MKKLQDYDRLFPVEGIEIKGNWSIAYKDVNDVDEDIRQQFHNSFYNDESYSKIRDITKDIPKGSIVGRRLCVYGWGDGKLIGSVMYTEYLDNPHGFGKDCYLTTKLILPEFRWTKFSRHVGTNILDMFFITGVVKKTYSYVPVFKEGEWWDVWNRIDDRIPCFGKMYPTDGPNTQVYMSVKQEFKTDKGVVLLIEMDGEKYRTMDQEKYFMAAPGRNMEYVKKWIDSIRESAYKVKETFPSEKT